jgi:hypothetical protein
MAQTPIHPGEHLKEELDSAAFCLIAKRCQYALRITGWKPMLLLRGARERIYDLHASFPKIASSDVPVDGVGRAKLPLSRIPDEEHFFSRINIRFC